MAGSSPLAADRDPASEEQRGLVCAQSTALRVPSEAALGEKGRSPVPAVSFTKHKKQITAANPGELSNMYVYIHIPTKQGDSEIFLKIINN